MSISGSCIRRNMIRIHIREVWRLGLVNLPDHLLGTDKNSAAAATKANILKNQLEITGINHPSRNINDPTHTRAIATRNELSHLPGRKSLKINEIIH